MTLAGWIFLVLLAAALAAATALRRRPTPRPPELARLPGRDDLAGLGLSEVRAVPVGQPAPSAARPATARPTAARPATVSASHAADGREVDPARTTGAVPSPPPSGESSDASAWIDGLLVAPEAPAGGPPSRPDAPADGPEGDATPDDSPGRTGTPDEGVWTFDHSAAETAPTPVASETAHGGEAGRGRPAYVREGQTLWPEGPDAAALLVASLAARLGGSAAVVRHDGAASPATYTVEMLAGPDAGGPAPAPMEAEGHPLHLVPQDGLLSLLDGDEAAALTYHAGPEGAAGQALVRALAGPPAARVLLVADVPVDAPEVDDETATLVDRYADLLADLTAVPLADGDAADLDEVEEGPSEGADEGSNDLLAGAPEGPEAPTEDEAATGDATEAPRPVEAVARPGTARAEPAPPPRGVILNAEIEAARRDRRFLVFALVTLADAEAEAVFGEGADAVVRAEAALRQRLAAAPAVRRVEPFGDLLFGAFLDAEGPEVAAWAARLSAGGPPLLVGAVPAAGAADVVRATATAALQRAYEQDVVCVVAP
ncbi:MAG TPA: hypothetical protein VF576_04160 [Rubricoccaceae bacterium]